MKRILLSSALVLACTPLLAQSSQCTELNGFLHSASSGWQLATQPKDFKPLSDTDACALSSAADGGALCVKKTPSLDSARQTAGLWLKELSTCLNVKSLSSQLKKVTAGPSTHEIMEFEPLTYRGMPMKMNLRLQYESSSPEAQVTWYLVPQPGNKDAATDLNICPMIAELTSPQALAKDWSAWQGPILEKGDGFTQYICAKVPHQAASRFDCDLKTSAQTLVLSTRWMYSPNLTEKVGAFASDIAQKVAACEVGMDWKSGMTRHVVDVPKKQVRIEVVSNKNDVGRGPSVTMTVQHWKQP